MQTELNCLRCPESALTPDAVADGVMRCATCHGTLLPADQVPEAFRMGGDATTMVTPGDVVSLVCPACQGVMATVPVDDAAFLCAGCGYAWIAATEETITGEEAAENPEQTASRLSRYLMYSFTLPERLARSAVGVTAGVARESAEFLVPQAFKNAKTYEVVIKNSLKFLTEDVGGVAPKADEVELGKDFAARKAVGNFVDLAGWATFAVSPVWVMAIVSDVAYGSKSYLHELAGELRKKGLIDETSSIHNVDDLLGAVKDASGQTASLVDSPPLSVEQLKESLDATRKAVGRADFRKLLPESEVRRYWQEMKEVSAKENVSFIGVGGALAMHTLGKMGRATQGAFTGAMVAGGLVNRHIFGHYRDAMNDVRERGFYETVKETSGPYVDAVWNNFAVDRPTWTAELLSGRAVGKAFTMVKGWFSRGKAEGDATVPQEPADERKE